MPELIYQITPLTCNADSQNFGALQLELALKEGGSFEKLAQPVDPRHLPSFLKAADVECLSLLERIRKVQEIEAKKRGQPPPPYDLRRLLIPGNRVEPLLKALAGSSKLYYQERQLLADFFSQTQARLLLKKSEEALDASLQIIYGRQTADLSQVQVLLGPPHFFLKDGFLRLLPELLSSKEIAQLARFSSLKEHEKRTLIDELEIEVEGEELGLLAPKDPSPLFKIKDALGLQGELYFNYGEEGVVSALDPKRPFRHLTSEKSLECDLVESGYRKTGPHTFECGGESAEAAMELLLGVGWHLIDQRGRTIHLLSWQMALEEEGEDIIVKGDLVSQNSLERFEIKKVALNWQSGQRLLPLSEKAVGIAPRNEAAEEVLQKLQLFQAKNGHLKKGQLAVFSAETLQTLYPAYQIPSLDPAPIAPSTAFQGTLRPYQEEGLAWLYQIYRARLGGILADEMGLGKTVQVIALLSLIDSKEPHLIVAPTSLLHNWQREVERFLPSLSTGLYWGAQKESLEALAKKHALIITSYSTLRLNQTEFARIPFHAIFLDEAQAIKNEETLTAKALYSLKGGFRLSITGTPVENHIRELFAQLRFLLPDLSPLFKAKAGALEQVKKMIRPFFLRRKKSAVARDLPPKIEQIAWIDFAEEENLFYHNYLNQARQQLLQKQSLGQELNRIEILEVILRLRQICCHPSLIKGFSGQKPEEPSKFNQLLADIEEITASGQKVIVFSQFRSMLDLMEEKLNRPLLRLDGQTRDREGVVKAFQEDAAQNLLLMSLRAGGVGLNLTQADAVLIYDPWWNDAVESQAIDRAHRIGRQGTVVAKRYITVDTIEAKMLQMKQEKKGLAEALFEDNDAPLSTEELMSLLLHD
ncbi:MAG: putative ATP-dependent helicase [Chlamydiales bacterium]|jgi:superfamily II DNA or RNA helicase|nr:putative ATP-dependent helicase [Chlamydiales bacterium]